MPRMIHAPLKDAMEDEPLWHYRRVCANCATDWAGLHCPHDLVQNNCPACGIRPIPADGECECEFDA